MILDHLPLDRSIPFRIGSGDSTRGFRIGGSPPLGVVPLYANRANYLLTLPLEVNPNREVSLFFVHSWNDIAFDKPSYLFGSQDKMIELIAHDESIRDPFLGLDELLTPHPLILKTITTDLMETDTVVNRQTLELEEITWERTPRDLVFDRETWRFVDALPATLAPDSLYEPEDVFPYSWHKLGGRPYLLKAIPKLVDALIEIEDQGFRQLLQLASPRFEDADIYGNFPFGGGLFYLYYRLRDGAYDWRYFWQY